MLELSTPRLLIRPFALADMAAIQHLLTTCFAADPDEQAPGVSEIPYGDMAVVERASGKVVGAVGYTPVLAPEVGLFWGILPDARGQGYATEAAQALVTQARAAWRLPCLVAATAPENLASQGVMRKLGMSLHRQSLQVVGVLVL